MSRWYLAVGTVFFVTALFFYASGPTRSRADLTYVNPSGIHTLDPVRMSWTQDFRVALNLWEGLTTWDPKTLEPIGGAAEYPPAVSDDGLTYTFTIRGDARWSNGDAVTAEDFVRGWRRGIEPGASGDYAFLITDRIFGAADYVAWRFEAVGRLLALHRLRSGWGIDKEQASIVAGLPGVRGRIDSGGDLIGQLESLSIDWGAVYREVFSEHAGDLEFRFGEVGIEARDARTLVVRLVRACPYFPDLLGLPVFLPLHGSIGLLREGDGEARITADGLVVHDPQWTKPGYGRNGYGGLVTNGPYLLDEWVFKRRLRMAVNPFHRLAGRIDCQTIDMLVYENISAAIMAYEAGQVDFLPAMDVSYDHEIARLSLSGERSDFHLCPALATFFLNFNCVSDEVNGVANPFVDGRVRKAFALAISREGIVDRVLRRGDRVARSFVPPDVIPGYDPPAGLGRDIAAARGLLVEAGYPGGAGLPPIEFLFMPSDELVSQALARMWEGELGVRVELRSRESRTFAEERANQRFMVSRGNWYADYADPTTFLDCLRADSGNNDSGYVSARYDALLDRAEAELDDVRRAALLRAAESIVVEDDFPIVPILHYATPIAIKPYVSGLYANARLWFPFRYVRVDR